MRSKFRKITSNIASKLKNKSKRDRDQCDDINENTKDTEILKSQSEPIGFSERNIASAPFEFVRSKSTTNLFDDDVNFNTISTDFFHESVSINPSPMIPSQTIAKKTNNNIINTKQDSNHHKKQKAIVTEYNNETLATCVAIN